MKKDIQEAIMKWYSKNKYQKFEHQVDISKFQKEPKRKCKKEKDKK